MKTLAALLFSLTFTAQAANTPKDAASLVSGCAGHKYFMVVPEYGRDQDEEERAVRAELIELIQEAKIFDLGAESLSTIRFAPKSGIGLNTHKLTNAMFGMLGKVEEILSRDDKMDSGGVYCVQTSGLPETH